MPCFRANLMSRISAKIVTLKAPHLRCKGWQQEAALRCLLNNLDPHVAEAPDKLVVYGGIGKAARNRECLQVIVRELESLQNDQTLLIQSGKPVAVFPTHKDAPRVLIANSNLVGRRQIGLQLTNHFISVTGVPVMSRGFKRKEMTAYFACHPRECLYKHQSLYTYRFRLMNRTKSARSPYFLSFRAFSFSDVKDQTEPVLRNSEYTGMFV